MSLPIRDQYARISSASVEKHTGKNWAQWFQLLEKQGASQMKHQALVAHLVRKYKLSLWWRQMVATGYEIHIGRKVEGRSEKGTWSLTVSKSILASQKRLWDFMISDEGQALWLKPLTPFTLIRGANFEIEGGQFGELRTFKKPDRLRLRIEDTELEKPWTFNVWTVKRPQDKSILVFTPEGLPTARMRQELRVVYRQRADEIGKYFNKKGRPKSS